MSVVTRLSDLSALGIAKEAVFGTAGTSNLWLPVHDFTPDVQPNVIKPQLIRQNRAAYTTVAPGIQHETFAFTAPLFPDAGNTLFTGIIGPDSVTGSTPTNSTTLASACAAGATTISTTATFANNSKIQVDSSASGIAEVFTVTGAPTGSGPFVVTLDRATKYAHLSAAAVANVVAPYTHTLTPTVSQPPSWSLEGNLNGADIQFFGSVCSKAEIKAATNAEVQVTWNFDAQQRQVIGSPATPTWPSDNAIGPAGVSLSIGGTADTTVSNLTFSVDNGTKVYDGLAGVYYPSAISAIERKLSAKCTVLLQNVAGGVAVADYYSSLVANPVVTNAIVLTLTSGTNVITWTMPACTLDKFSPKIKKGDFIMADLEFSATLAGGVSSDVTLAIANGSLITY